MREIKKGDMVSRNSYKNDIMFEVKRILKLSSGDKIAILKGTDVRVEADAPIEDLQIISKEEKINRERELEKRILNKVKKEKIENGNRKKEIIHTGRILHLDGDTHLSNQKKYSNTNTSEQVIFNHNKNNVSKIKIHYFFITKREEFCEREHI